jgi:uncharacterized protein YciI
MLFAIMCLDNRDALELRKANREDHLAHLRRAGDRIRLAGPMLDNEGVNPVGSLIILEAPDYAAASAFADEDPYFRTGVFQSVTVRPFRWTMGSGFSDQAGS